MTDVADQSGERLAPLPPEQWGDEEYAAFGKLLGIPGDKVPRAGSGHAYDPVNFDVIGLLVRHPDLARVFLTYNGFLLQSGQLPPRLRELLILRVAHVHRSAFEWGQHVKMGAAAGVSEDEITALTQGNSAFEGADLMVLEIADELLANGRADWATWQRLALAIGERQAMEVIFVVGTYVLTGMAFGTWRVPPAAGSAPLP